MNWISRWFGKDTDVSQDTEAQEARADAAKKLHKAREQTSVVDDAVRRARELRRTNNWGPRIRKALSVE